MTDRDDTLPPDEDAGSGVPDEVDGVRRLPLHEYTERAYLDYSMYVINDRALPSLRDGMKPVQRRIIYAMSQKGLNATAKYAKSALTVGDTLGNYHPHGDSAIYEAMVLMAQPFSYRYPLVDGQGNWGAPDDPKSFAAMRYTEARLSRYAELLLDEIGQGTVDWAPNFDGRLDEPLFLPARLPMILLNGSTGIAVGMATDIPPHNMREIGAALLHLLSNPKSTTTELMAHVPAPDYPTDATIITPAADLAEVYEKGRGSVRARARWQRENGDVIITALPHQVSPARVLEQIAAQMQARNLPMVVDLRDESDHENPTRLVLTLRSNRVDTERLMSHLFASTDLERSYRVNLNMIGTDGKPAVRGLRDLLKEWLEFRRETVRRRIQYRIDRIDRRLHLLEGMLIAFLNLDEVIRIVREEDKPKELLMSSFALSEIQADYILDTRLRALARLEEMRIQGERDELVAERDGLQKTLDSKARMTRLLTREIKEAVEEYGDERRSPLQEVEEAKAFSDDELISSEPVTIILSEKGWIRSAKGHEIDPAELNYRSGDALYASARGRTNQSLVFLDSTGRSYSVVAHTLPSARGQGEPLSGRLNPPSGAQFRGVLIGDGSQQIVLATSSGYGFVASLSDMVSKNKAGKQMITVPANSAVLAPVTLPSEGAEATAEMWIAAASNQGRLLIFPLAELPVLSKGKGNKILQLPKTTGSADDEVMISLAVLTAGDTLVVRAGARHLNLKEKDMENYRGERARRGRKLPRGFQRVDGIEVG